jgi:Cadherin-like
MNTCLRHVLQKLPLLAAAGLVWQAHAGISEPDAIFYGQVINRTSGQVNLLTQGTLAWVINPPDGTPITLTASLQPLAGGRYSYKLPVPQEALGYGLTASGQALPLAAQPATCSMGQITIDGAPATIVAPGSSTFAVSEASRAATYRLDLEVLSPELDTASDGIPDWWKAKYGVTDANADADGDGWTALQEFLMGGNPNIDNRIPTLATTELTVYADGTSGLLLQAVDSDSTPTNLFYTLTALPQTGTLYLRDAAPTASNHDAALGLNSTFTQADVNQGRLIFVHQGASSTAAQDTFAVSLHDENPSHPATTGTVVLNVYRPSYPDGVVQLAQAAAASPGGAPALAGLSAGEQQMLLNYFLSRDHGFIVWDASRAAAPQELAVLSSGLGQSQYAQFVASYGPDRPQVLIGGAAGDHLSGGMAGDILVGGRGNDTLRGNGGADLFVFSDPSDGNDTIEDFNPAEGDAIDISRLLTGSARYVTNYVQLTSTATASYLGINFSGAGAGFTNMVVTLPGAGLSEGDLPALVDNRSLLVGDKVFPPTISIEATIANASENGPVAGEFTLTRAGDTNSALTVSLQVTGSAVNGSDYQTISPLMTFAPGQRTLVLPINPYPNNAVFPQYVRIAVASGPDYDVGALSVAQVSIEPLAPQLSIGVLEPVASVADQAPGVFLLTRGGVLDSSVLVRLSIGGTAPAGHYAAISSYVNFLPQQTTALINVLPEANAAISNGVESVVLTLNPDPAYKLVGPSTARVFLVAQRMTLGLWQQEHFPGSTEDTATFGAEDPGQTGIPNLFRYAFGLDALNPRASRGLPVFGISQDRLSVSFSRPAAVSDLNYVVEVSSNLFDWLSGSNEVEQFTASGSNDLETVSFRSKSAVSATPRQFMRVRLAPKQ